MLPQDDTNLDSMKGFWVVLNSTAPVGDGLNLGLFICCAVIKSYPLSFGFQRPFHDVIIRFEKVNYHKPDHASVKVDFSPLKSPLVH